MKKKLFIFSNESISLQSGKHYCDNINLKSTPEGLNKNFEVNLFGRKSNKDRSHEIKLKKIKIHSNILSYIFSVIKSAKEKGSKYLIISISPYTFIVSLFLRLFGRKPVVYLQSDGYEEYKIILGKVGPFIYHLMFSITVAISDIISCRDFILKGKKGKLISPSQLDSSWFRKFKLTDIKNFKLLYVGRIRIEKGIYSLLSIIKNKKNLFLTIVGAEKETTYNIDHSNVKVLKQQNNKFKLIKYYDDHNIFILPSYTEGYPMVLLEALSRRRPVIVFEDIKHVIGNKKGIFVSKRNYVSFFGTLNNIKKNYKKIQKEMKKNKLPTNKDFVEKLAKHIDDF